MTNNQQERQSKIKYVITYGEMMSKNDGDIHFISPLQIAKLYGVNIKECIEYNLDERKEGEKFIFDKRVGRLNRLIHLCLRWNREDYNINKCEVINNQASSGG